MRAKSLTLLAAILSLASVAAHASFPIPAPPALNAHSYILEDARSGHILVDQNADKHVEPASITKLMTAYVVFHALKAGTIHLDDQVLISKKAWQMPGSRMFIEVGHKVTVKKLLQGMIVQSGNDATVALAEHVAGSESSFVDLMNQYAKRLGMKESHFMDASGLPHPSHYMSAHDIAILARAIITEFPDEYHWFSEKDFTWNNIHQNNRNLLLWRDPSVDGLKTGHTESAGYCLVASAKRGDMRLISVVMGTPSEDARATYSESLLNYGFNFYEGHNLYTAGKELTTARVWKGEIDAVPVGLKSDLYVTIPRGSYKELSAKMALQATVMAPLTTDSKVGMVKVSLEGKLVAEEPLYPLQPVARGGIWRRMVDSIMLLFK